MIELFSIFYAISLARLSRVHDSRDVQTTIKANEKQAALFAGITCGVEIGTSTAHKMKIKNYNIGELSKAEAVKQSHTMRVQLEAAGVGALSFGVYVSARFAGAFIADSVAQVSSAKGWQKGYAVLITGEHGTLARIAEVSDDKKAARIGGKVVALGAFGTLSLVALSQRELVTALLSGEHGAEGAAIVRRDGTAQGQTLQGIGFARDGWKTKGGYASLAMAVAGKLAFADMEWRANAYNKGQGVLSAIEGEASESALAAVAGLNEEEKKTAKAKKATKKNKKG